MTSETTVAGAGKAGFNLSKWALDHPALTRYLMLVLMLLGFAAYFQLGQDAVSYTHLTLPTKRIV